MAIKSKIELKQQNDAQITTNTNREITGAIMHNHLNDIIDSFISQSELTEFDIIQWTVHFPTTFLPIAISKDINITIESIVLNNISSIEISKNGGAYTSPSYPESITANEIFRIRVISFTNPSYDGVIQIKGKKI